MPTIVLKTKEGKLVYCLLMWLSLGITTKKISPEDAAVLIKNISDNPTVGYQILVKRLGNAGVISSFPVAIDDNPELSSINFSPRAGAGWIGVGNELGKSIDPNEWVNILEYIATSPGMVEVVDVDTLYNIDILQEACIPDSLLQKCLNGDAEASNKIAEIISAKTKEKIMQAQTAEEVKVEEPKKEETKKEETKKEETKEETPWYRNEYVKLGAAAAAGIGIGMLAQKTLFGGCDVTIVSGDSNGLGLW
jgi:hypothetical protein